MRRVWDGLKRFRSSDGLPLLIIVVVLGTLVGHYCFFSPESDTALPECGITVRVLLAAAPPGESLHFAVDGPYKVFRESGGPRSYQDDDHLYYGVRLRDGMVELDDEKGLLLNGNPLAAWDMAVVPEDAGALRHGGTRYGGLFEFRAEPDGSLSIINALDMEHYLAGVLFKEMPPSFEDEALKAQVVAARSYAFHRQTTGARLMTDDARSQMYGGLSAECARSIRLVKDTLGEVLAHEGRILPAYYSSTCGGISASASEAFNGDAPMPVNQNHPCGYCTDSPFYEWRAEFTLAEIRRRFELSPAIAHFEVGVTGYDNAKRATELSFVDGRGGVIKRYPAESFRRIINQDRPLRERLLSTRIDRITLEDEKTVFEGKGWGHGVGLCQYGAHGLARAGKSYREILQYYYPGAKIVPCFGARPEDG